MIYARHSVLKRGCSIWDESQMPKEEFDARMKAARRQMAQRGLAALVIYGDTWSYADLCYLTNYFPKVRGGLAVVPLQGEVSILVNIGSRDVPFARSLTWVEDVRSSAQLGQDCAAVLKALHLEHAKVGFVDQERGFPLPQSEELKNSVPAVQWEDSSLMLSQMRLRKSKRETAILEEAGFILKEICEAAREIVWRGGKEYEIVAEIDRLARLKGAEDLRILTGDDKLHPAGMKEIQSRPSHFALYLAIQYRRYWVEVGRTYIGLKDNRIDELYMKAKGTVKLMANALGAAKSTAHVDAIARKELGELYPGASIYGLGNGVGLSQWEAPFIAEEPEVFRERDFGPASLEEDMAVALRVAFQAEGTFILAGDSYQITPGGVRVLTV